MHHEIPKHTFEFSETAQSLAIYRFKNTEHTTYGAPIRIVRMNNDGVVVDYAFYGGRSEKYIPVDIVEQINLDEWKVIPVPEQLHPDDIVYLLQKDSPIKGRVIRTPKRNADSAMVEYISPEDSLLKRNYIHRYSMFLPLANLKIGQTYDVVRYDTDKRKYDRRNISILQEEIDGAYQIVKSDIKYIINTDPNIFLTPIPLSKPMDKVQVLNNNFYTLESCIVLENNNDQVTVQSMSRPFISAQVTALSLFETELNPDLVNIGSTVSLLCDQSITQVNKKGLSIIEAAKDDKFVLSGLDRGFLKAKSVDAFDSDITFFIDPATSNITNPIIV